MPFVVQRQVRGSMIQKMWWFRSCSSSMVINIPVVTQRLFPVVQTVLWAIKIHQLLVDKVVDAPVMQVLQVSQVVIIPVVSLRLIPMVLTVQQTIEISQLLFDKVVDVPVVLTGRASSTGAGCGGDSLNRTVAARQEYRSDPGDVNLSKKWTRLLTCPLVVGSKLWRLRSCCPMASGSRSWHRATDHGGNPLGFQPILGQGCRHARWRADMEQFIFVVVN